MRKSILLKSILFLPFIFIMCTNPLEKKIENDVFELTVLEDAITKEIWVSGKIKSGSGNETFIVDNSLLHCIPGQGTRSRVLKKNNSIEIIRELKNDSLNVSCTLSELYSFNADGSLHCQLKVEGNEEQIWDTSIESSLHYKNSATFWTAWAAPNFDEASAGEKLLHVLTLHDYDNTRNTFHGWRDPLVSVPLSDVTYFYGAPAFDYDTIRSGFIPFQENLFSIPIATLLDAELKKGLTMVLSPADNIFDVVLETRATGSFTFRRLFNRISRDNVVSLNFDIVVHEDDWRCGLAWMRDHYEEYFYPVNDAAFDLDGTGAYSSSNFYDVDIDADRMKKMSFKVNWQASFDFPYMGMFIPPVTSKRQKWQRFGGDSISIQEMNQSAKNYRENGFAVLSYFNVTEFGSYIKFPPELPENLLSESDLWKDANQMLYTRFQDAILPLPEKSIKDPVFRDYKGAVPYYTWEGGIAMDCAEPDYQRFLLDQLHRHMTDIPDASGICIDRLDWIRMYNETADDGISCYRGKRTRSQVSSWKTISDSISHIVHKENKLVFVNNHSKRIDILKNVDGIFDEFTYAGTALNLTAFLCINKPALGWTSDAGNVTSVGGDSFMQKYLYMGVFPMCPFPGNDHSIVPSEEADQFYLDYGPLMKLMEGAEWVLKPHVIEFERGLAKANIFRIPSGYSIPVIHALTDTVEIRLRGIDAVADYPVEVYHPGTHQPVVVKGITIGDDYIISVPVKRNCAMVHLKRI